MQKKPLPCTPPKMGDEIGERSSFWKRMTFPQTLIQGKLVWIGGGNSLK